MNSDLVSRCDEELLGLLYYVFLGRDPGPDNVWLGAPLAEVASGILASEEFRNIGNACLELKFTSPQPRRARSARASSAESLVRHGAPTPRTNAWHDLLLSGLEWMSPILVDDQTRNFVDPVSQVLEAEFRGEVDIDDLIDDKIRFDPEWFRATNKDAVGLDRLSNADLEYYATQSALNGEAEISPSFPISGHGKQELRREIFYNLGDIHHVPMQMLLRRIKTAAKKGLVDHWLFDKSYYLTERSKAFARHPHVSWEPLELPYLDFLAYGDRSGVRPHPLFCPVAYKTLNSGLDDERCAFAHYLRRGQFLEYRTSALFDPEFYKALNPLVPLDIANGRFDSALESFCKEGIAKDLLFSPDFDRDFYLGSYSDVSVIINSENISAGRHFLSNGAGEGRRSNPYFNPQYYQQRYPFVGEICRKLSISAIEHFLLFGIHEGMRPSEPLLDREIDIFQAKGIYERRALASLINVSNKPLDFSDFTGPDPLLSIIVPVHNQLSFTARFLELAHYACAEMKRRTGGLCELIIVSNGSTDKTTEFLQAIGGIKTVITVETLGYLRAVNEGFRTAIGRYLLIVNNDVEFDPGTFADLVASFVETSNCGALGPRILSMDLTVQENGSFIARDGSTFGYGRGRRSSHLSGKGKEVVDYVSGCFLFMERNDFDTLGGFDEEFSPGYYEEVDLCLRIAETLGKDVVVDRGLSILHYEHASFMKGRPSAVNFPLILRNRKRIMRKQPRISEKPSHGKFGTPAALSGRGGEHKSRVLVIDDLIPDSRLGSGFSRTAEVLRVFHKLGVAFEVLALNPTKKVDEYEFPDVALYRDWMPGESLEELLKGDAGGYSHIWVCRTHNLNRLAGHFKTYKDRHNATIICDMEAISVQRTVEMARIQGRVYSDTEVLDLVSSELSGASVADHFVAVSERDAAMIRSAGINQVSVVAHSVKGLAVSENVWEERNRILFIGSVHSALSPNFDNISWFVNSVLPKIKHLGKKFTIAGYWHEDVLDRFDGLVADQDIEFTGMVSDATLAKLYSEAVLAVAPTRFAVGNSCKVIEAMLTGTPIVMSSVVGDQIGLSKVQRSTMAVAPVADDGESFAKAVIRLVGDRDWWTSVRDAQRKIAGTKFSLSTLSSQVSALLHETGALALDNSPNILSNSSATSTLL